MLVSALGLTSGLHSSTVIRADDPNIQFIGRSQPGPTAGTIEFDMPGCEIRAKLVLAAPSCVSINLGQRHEAHPTGPSATGNTKNSGYQSNAFVVWVDGKRQAIANNATFVTVVPDAAVYPYDLSGAPSTEAGCVAWPTGPHDFRIFKATEADWNGGSPVANFVTFHGFTVHGSAAAPATTAPGSPLPTRKIEFLGDSITAGYCNECPQALAELGAPIPSDHSEAYGATWDHQICELLDAQCHTAAWSGLGMVRNCCGGNTTMPVIFKETLATVSAQGGGVAWDWSKWVTDALVINLGTNDGSASTDPKYTYVQTYTDLVMNASVNYGKNLHVFLACGPMSEHYCEPVFDVIGNLTSKGVHAHFLDQRGFLNGTFGPACCGHPSIEVDTAMAKSGAAFIKATMGW